jgi:hypothetical protein
MKTQMSRSRSTRPRLAVIPAQPEPEGLPPPAGLDETGRELWRQITGTFEWDDPVPYRVLHEACLALQRAERCRRLIDEQGEMIRTKTGMKAHPLLRDEAAARALGCRLLARLGTDLEPVRPMGRPGGS